MRVLFVTFPNASHFYPMVPLAWALRAAGHEVLVAAPPAFVPVVERSGLPVLAAGADVPSSAWRNDAVEAQAGRLWETPEERRSHRAMVMFTLVGEAMAEGLLPYARSWRPDLVVCDSRGYAGLVVAARLGVPMVRHLWGTDYVYSRWEFERRVVEPMCERLGVAAPEPFGALTVDVCPPSLQIATAPERAGMRYIPFNGPGVARVWPAKRAGRPRVCLTWGHMFAERTGHLDPLRMIGEVLGRMPVEVVVAVGPGRGGLVADLPGEVRVVEGMPLSLLLPDCDAIVHQGGAGTTFTSAALGVPQLVVPAIGDQFVNARQIAGAMAGRVVPFGQEPADLRTGVQLALRELLGSAAAKAAARRIAAENRQAPPPAEQVAVLAALADGAPVR